MAEAFKKFYDTTLTKTNLNDGEETLISGGNNKVIKQISITSPDQKLSNTYLELDGKNIANISLGKGGTYNLEGHLIVPSSSTLKLKTSDWPIVAQKVVGICYDGSRLRYYYYIEKDDGTAHDISHLSGSLQTALQSEFETEHTSLSYASDMIDLYFMYTTSGGENIYWHGHDNNSVQTYYVSAARSPGNTTTSSINNQQLTYNNYRAFGLLDWRRNWLSNTNGSVTDQRMVEMRSNGQFIGHRPFYDPSSFTIYGLSYPTYWNQSTGHPSPYPTSSYPRGHAYHGMYWYIPSNSNPQELYMKNMMNGAFYKFNFDASISYADGDFIISVDHSADEWYLYIYRSNTLVGQYKSNISWTDLRTAAGSAAVTALTRKDLGHTWYNSRTDITVPQMPGNFRGSQFGFTPKGGFRTKTNSNEMITFDNTGNELYRYSSDPMFGRTSGSTSYAWRHFGVPIISSEAGSAGVNDADLKVTVTGIEQT